ncbi:MAG: CreA family protein [Pseudomonadota bacterium]
MFGKIFGTVLMCTAGSTTALADEIGSVDTKFNLLSPDDSIKIEVFDDPSIEGVACYLSRAEKGGYKGVVGIAEDTSDASIECLQVGPINITDDLEEEQQVFNERRSLVFKRMKVVRFCDTPRNTIVYMVYSERVIEGSPKNSISAVPITRWAGVDAKTELPVCRYAD